MNYLARLFRSLTFELVIVFLILASVVFAGASFFTDLPWLEQANLGFSLFFCFELSLRFLAAENPRKYWKSYWLDWVASIPWDFILLTLTPTAGLPVVWLRLLRLPRIARILRFISIGRQGIGRRAIYHIKKQLEKSLPRQFLMLAALAGSLYLLFGFVFSQIKDETIVDPYYFSLITLMSSDSIFEVAQGGSGIRTATIILAFLGMILFNGILIAIIVSRITEYLENVRSGRGRVEERNHLIILGWHGFVKYLTQELELYSRTEGQQITLVLLVEEISQDITDLAQNNTLVDVVVRRGRGYNQQDIDHISLSRARAVFALGHGSLSENNSVVLKTLLTMESILSSKGTDHPWESAPPRRSLAGTWPHIVANLPEGTLETYLPEFPGDSVITFDPFFYSAKILASVVRTPELYQVYTELFSFDGSEFYGCRAGNLAGLRYCDLPGVLPGIQLCGLLENNQIRLIPPQDTVLQADHTLLVLGQSRKVSEAAFRNHSVQRGTSTQPVISPLQTHQPSKSGLEVAIIGVNPKIPFIVEELLKHKCRIHVIDDQSKGDFNAWYEMTTGGKPPRDLHFIPYSFHGRSPLNLSLELQSLDRIIILADESAGQGEPGKVDADTIHKLLKLRKLIRDLGFSKDCQIVAEIMAPESEGLSNLFSVNFFKSRAIIRLG
ncbi:ion transporter [Spirochaeta lutea]|uniref:Uncharacterized protein n=1 Tax=Spirochaeta lutea TaxID=1480694 RepID=A0A098QVQ1_9SPIO|nr:ion transporter [Spirochaeta lutea]KGE71473.1 hypothetical protein DC28_11930 [Spirochaeta lutea]